MQDLLARLIGACFSPDLLILDLEVHQPYAIPSRLTEWSEGVQRLPSEVQDLIFLGIDDLQLVSLVVMRSLPKDTLQSIFFSRTHLVGALFWSHGRPFSFDFELLWDKGALAKMHDTGFRIDLGSIQKVSLEGKDIRAQTFLYLPRLKEMEIRSVFNSNDRTAFPLTYVHLYPFMASLERLILHTRLQESDFQVIEEIAAKAKHLSRLELQHTGLEYPLLQALAFKLQSIRRGFAPLLSHNVYIEKDALILGSDVF